MAVPVRSETGTILGTSPETPGVTNVLFLSADAKNGWMLFFKVEPDGTVEVIRNGYRLQRTNGGWSAGEGNGGVATYQAISAYVAAWLRRPAVRLTLSASGRGCEAE